MKKKLILIIILGILASILIYYLTLNNKLKLLALGDGLASGMTAYNVNGYSYNDYLKDFFKSKNNLESYNNGFTEANITIRELITRIKDNYIVNINGKDTTIQQAISEANVIIIAIGIDELATKSLNNELTQKVINNYYKDMQELLSLIKKYNHDKVIVLGIYDAYHIKDVEKININLKEITQKFSYDFVDISKVINNKEYYFNDTSYYLNYKGHKKINEELQKVI